MFCTIARIISRIQKITCDLDVKVTLKKISLGTDLQIIQDGLPDKFSLDACYLGWQQSFENLARLVEPKLKL